MSICLLRLSCTGLDAMNIAPWLSPQSGIGRKSMPNSFIRTLIQTSCLHASDSDIYSASVEESAIVHCALVFQQTTPLASLTM